MPSAPDSGVVSTLQQRPHAPVTRTWSWAEAGLLVAAAGAVVLAELVLWSGQPSGDPTDEVVMRWYADQATAVLSGDVLWVAACCVLGVALWRGHGRLSTTVHGWARALVLTACTALVSAALVAAGLALGALPGSAAAWWRLEGLAYLAGTAVLAVVMVAAAVDELAGRQPVAASVDVLVALLLVGAQTRLWGLVATYLVLALPRVRTGRSDG